MHKDKRVLVCWYTDPGYIPPFVLSDRQVTVGPQVHPDQILAPFDGYTPQGRYDLLAALATFRLPTEFDAIVVAADASLNNRPLNLEAFDCPKVLFLGDTQHQRRPIRNLIEYAKAARYDFVLSANNRQHLHWFIEAGFSNVAWLPGLKVKTRNRPFSRQRRAQVCFFGQSGTFHVRRAKFLAELKSRNPFPLAVMAGQPDEAADQYASSAVSLNYSLNGDLNMRVFEILAAGGCLLTDRLSDQSGLGLLLKEGEEFIAYDDIDECIEQARFLLHHPETALAVARAGNAAFMSRLRPEQRVQQLLDWVFKGQLDSFYRVLDFPRPESGGPSLEDRIRIYEKLQELHRIRMDPAALVMNNVPEIHVVDALDLRHLKFAIVDEDAKPIYPRSPAIAGRCLMTELRQTRWDCLISTEPASGHTAVIPSPRVQVSPSWRQGLTASRLKAAIRRRVKAAVTWPRA